MALTLTAPVIAELLNARVNMVELVELKISDQTVYIANRGVTASNSFDGRNYQSLMLRGSARALEFPTGRDKFKATFQFDDSADFFTNLINGGSVFENGVLSVVKLFPNLAPPNNRIGDWGPEDTSGAPNADGPYWTGRILRAWPRDDIFTIEAEYGLFSLGKRAYRKFQSSCQAQFADGHTCPYSVLDGYGAPKETDAGFVSSATATSMTVMGKNFTTLGIQVNDVILAWLGSDETKVTTAKVMAVGTDTLTVDSWRFTGPPAATWNYQVGPEFTGCDFTFPSCQLRKMAGPSSAIPKASLNKIRRKWFMGLGPIAQTRIKAAARGFFGLFRPSRYSYPSANEGLEGEVIPVPVGLTKLELPPILSVGTDEDRIHSLIVLGEGRCHRLLEIELDGETADDQNLSDPPEQGSVVTWGFDDHGDEAAAVTSGELTERQRLEALGQRLSDSLLHGQEVDKYENNPWLFADQYGFGSYLSGLSTVYLRTDPDEINFQRRAKAYLWGLVCRDPAGGTTANPTFADFFYELALNGKFGGALDAAQVNATAAAAISTWAKNTITGVTAPKVPTLNHTVNFGPDDSPNKVNARGRKFIQVVNAAVNEAYVGAELEITQLGKEQTRTVTAVEPFDFEPPTRPDRQFSGIMLAGSVGVQGAYIFVDEDWDVGKIPANGDSFTMRPTVLVQRHGPARGNPAKDEELRTALQMAMDNGLGSFYQKNGILTPAVRKQESLAAINALPTFTDANTLSRNVLVEPSGKSSLYFEPTPADKLYNQLDVEFVDRETGKWRSIVVKNQAHQDWIRTKYGHGAKTVIKAKMVLNLVDSLEEAFRLGALWLRHFGARPNAPFTNGKIYFKTPIHNGIQLRPIEDVYPISGGNLDAYSWISYVRIEKVKEDLSGGFMEVEGIPYVHDDYDFTADGYDVEVPPGPGPHDEFLAPLIPAIPAVTETVNQDPRGKPFSTVDVYYTLPTDPNNISKPLRSVRTYHRLRSQPIEHAIEGANVRANYSRDDHAAAGVQNRATFTLDHSTASEDLVIHCVSVSQGRQFKAPRWMFGNDTGTVADVGGINASTQTINVTTADPVWAVGKSFRIGSEICTITAITPGTPQVWTVVRGDHGTTGQSHAQGASLQHIEPNCATAIKTLDGVLTGISAPSALVAEQQPNSIRLTWDTNLDAQEFARLEQFYLVWDTSSRSDPDPNPPAVNPYANGPIPIGVVNDWLFYPVDAQTYYFRVFARDLDGNDTAWSGEANAAKGITEILDPSKPNPPITDFIALGGNAQSGFVFRIDIDGDATPPAPGLNGITKAQFQVGKDTATFSPTTGLSVVVKYADGATDADEVPGDVPWNGERTFLLSSKALGGEYQMTARVYNAAGDVWSDWATPLLRSTIEGQADANPPNDLTGAVINVEDYPGAKDILGSTVHVRLDPPDAEAVSLRSVLIQSAAAGTPDATWADDVDDTYALDTSSGVSGTGTVNVGQRVLTVTTSTPATPFTVDEFVNQYMAIADSHDLTTGQIVNPQVFVVVSNTTTTITVRAGADTAFDRTGTVQFVVGTPKAYNFNRQYRVSEVRGGFSPPVVITATGYWRSRWENSKGHGRWHYHNGVSGTTVKADALLFIVQKIKQGAFDPGAVAAADIEDVDLQGIAGLTTDGLITRVSEGNIVTRSIVGTANQVNVVNGDGVGGDPTLSLPAKILVGVSLPGSPDGVIHAHTASAGLVTAHANADELVLENSTLAGMSILTNRTGFASIHFGDEDSNIIGRIIYDHSADSIRFFTDGTERASFGADLTLFGDLSAVRATLTQATGTAPLTVSSTTLVTNLNADMLDGLHSSSFQPSDSDLTALAALATTGLAARTAADTWALRTVVGTVNQVNVVDGGGASGNPTLSLPQDIHSGASVQFAKLGLGSAPDRGAVDVRTSSATAYSATSGSADSDVAVHLQNSHASADFSALRLRTRETSASIWELICEHQASNQGDLAFKTRTGAATFAERMRLRNDGTLDVATAVTVAGSNLVDLYQPLDPDLTALAALSSTGIAARTGAGTWALRTMQQPAAGMTITNPGGVAGDPTFALANDLLALETIIGTGFSARTATDSWSLRTLVAPAAGLTIAQPSGTGGNPTFALADDLAALEGITGTGIAVRTGTSAWALRTITGTANEITVTNGNGVSGNPTLSLPSSVSISNLTVSGGTLNITGATAVIAATTVPGIIKLDSSLGVEVEIVDTVYATFSSNFTTLKAPIKLEERASAISSLATGSECAVYMKGDKFVVAYRQSAGEVKYRYIDLTSTDAVWTYTTTAP